MPLAIPPADLHASTSASNARSTHTRLNEPTEEQGKFSSLDDAEYGVADEKFEQPQRRGGVRGAAGRAMEFLVEHGVEVRGIDPVPEDVSLSVSSKPSADLTRRRGLSSNGIR
jgi:hypothetical protein